MGRLVRLGCRRYTRRVPARSRILVFTILGLVLLGIVVWRVRRESGTIAAHPVVSPDPIPLLAGATGWLNGTPATADSLRGGPVLILVWSDTDPVSLRVLPDVQSWQQAYGRFELRVIGVHMPQYAFAADTIVPARALQHLAVQIPVALDASMRIAPQLGAGGGLPAWVVLDTGGRTVYSAQGDRERDVHHALLGLIERRFPGTVTAGQAPGEQPDHAPTRVYCGTARVRNGPLAGTASGEPITFTAQFRYQEEGDTDVPYPVGRWTPSSEGVTSARGGATDYLAMRYSGGAVDAVMERTGTDPQRVWVLCDDAWLPDSLSGDDVRRDSRGASYLEVDEPRLYSVVKNGGGHVLKLSPEGTGTTFYEFVITPP